jgi:Ice-binding-like/Bacterial Ig-like domain
MHKVTVRMILAFLMAGFMAGCCDPVKNAGDPETPPTVLSETPPIGAAPVCPNTAIVSVTFSKAMNPATINTTTFTLTIGGVGVLGQVSYVVATDTATFTPTVALGQGTYTAMITTGAADTFGNTLAASFMWMFTTSASCAPTVISETPPIGAAPVCPNTAIISATFSKAMNPATINMTTFTLTTGGVGVLGQVSYVAATDTATFTPTVALSPSATYTAMITTGAADTFGNTLAAPFMWMFMTSASCTPPVGIVTLGAACTYGILGATPVVSSVGPTVVTGDVGIWPAASITGFPPGTLTGTEHLGDANAMMAQGALTTAYNAAAGAAGGTVLTADIGGQTLPAGVYKTTSAQPTLGITGNLTLNGGGDPNSTWIFQIMSSLTTAAGNSQVILENGASAHNVFWQVGSSATLGTNTIFQGTILADVSITLTTGATLDGRALASTGAVSLDSNPVNVPACP